MLRTGLLTIDLEIKGGTPVFTGAQVPVQALFNYLGGYEPRHLKLLLDEQLPRRLVFRPASLHDALAVRDMELWNGKAKNTASC